MITHQPQDHSTTVGTLYDRHSAELDRALARSYPQVSGAMREDAASHAWEQLLRKPADFLHYDASPMAWLFVVARHELWKLAGNGTVSLDVMAETTGQTADSELELSELRSRIGRLKPAQQVAMTARLLGLSYHQVMKATGRSYTWVNRHTVEGRKALAA